MNTKLIAFNTIVKREISRFTRIWIQTILPSGITMTLYFIIFGNLIGKRIGAINGVDYLSFLAPGLIMMAIITNSYANVVSSFYGSRFQRNIEEILVSPTPNYVILLGYIIGGVARGICVGLLVTFIAISFTHLSIQHIFITISVALCSSTLFALAGFTNAIFAKKFDDINLVPTFVLTPLTYFGGVFYSVSMLPLLWQKLSHINPILYMVNTFRYGIIGISDVNILFAFIMIIVFIVALFCLNLTLLNRGVGIRT